MHLFDSCLSEDERDILGFESFFLSLNWSKSYFSHAKNWAFNKRQQQEKKKKDYTFYVLKHKQNTQLSFNWYESGFF